MSDKRIDKRIIHSKQFIKNALIELMKEKTIDRISAVELCSRADVNRKTFYAHYFKVEDVLEEAENEMVAQLKKHALPEEEKPDTVSLLKYIQKHSNEYLSLMQNRSSRINEKMQVLIIDYGRRKHSGRNLSDRAWDIYCKTSNYGSTLLIEDWLNSGCSQPAEKLSSMIDNISTAIFQTFLEYMQDPSEQQ